MGSQVSATRTAQPIQQHVWRLRMRPDREVRVQELHLRKLPQEVNHRHRHDGVSHHIYSLLIISMMQTYVIHNSTSSSSCCSNSSSINLRHRSAYSHLCFVITKSII